MSTPTLVVCILIILGITFLAGEIIDRIVGKHEGPTTNDDWEIGGRDLPLIVVIGTTFATSMGGGILVGQVGNGYMNGFSVFLYAICANASTLVLMIIAKWLREHQFATMPEILLHFSGPSRAVAVLAALMSVVAPFGWSCSNLTAFAKLYTQLTGIPINTLIVIMAVISLFFIIPSGLKTVAWTDTIFGFLMMGTGAAVLAYTMNMADGWATIAASVPREIVEMPGSLFSVGLYTATLWIFSLTPGGLTNQLYFQRILACKNLKDVNRSLLLSTIPILLAYVWAVFMGLGIRSMNPGLPEGEGAIGWLITQLPAPLLVLFSALVMATILSTISSGIQSVVVNLNRDIYRKFVPDVDEKKSVLISRVLSVVVVLAAALVSMWFPRVMDMLVLTYSYSTAGLLCPIFLSYFLRKRKFITKNSIIAGIVVGVLVCMVTINYEYVLKVPYIIYSILASGLAMVIVALVERKRIGPDSQSAAA